MQRCQPFIWVQGPVYIRRESKGRGGKPVTLVGGLALETSALSSLAKKLRKRIGVGGSVVNGEILLQGDHRAAVQTYLSSAGLRLKSVAARHTILITASELADELKGKAPPVLLDCRFNLLDPGEGRAQYREGHIPSALYLHLNEDLSAPVEPGQTGRHPLPNLSALGQLLARLGINKDTPVVIYDQHQAGFAGAVGGYCAI